MFPWKDFWMGRIRKIENHKEERADQKNSKKQEGKNGRKKKKRSFTCVEVRIFRVFSISWEHPWAPTLM
jgi:hypothetical protein